MPMVLTQGHKRLIGSIQRLEADIVLPERSIPHHSCCHVGRKQGPQPAEMVYKPLLLIAVVTLLGL